jgi:1-acyl-sn-glycerol-3-phosphate acyltransferase
MKIPGLYQLMRWILGIGLGFYFRRIERFHPERVPQTGPVLFVCNHPNSLTDSFVVGAAVPRKVNFIATVQLFQFTLLKWLLSSCGVIPINRLKDDPRAMRSIADTFEACYRVLERGEAVGIFPEGITHDDPQLKTVKTGAARMALELERRHRGKLGLQIVPVGLTLSAKDKYRSEALVNFGEPIRVAEFLPGYPESKKECVTDLTAEIERRIQALILHIPQLEHARVVDAVKRLYPDNLREEDAVIPRTQPQAEELRHTQTIAGAVEYVHRTQPERASAFVRKLDLYHNWLARLKLSDKSLEHAPRKRNLAAVGFLCGLVAILGAPIALYGWAHRLAPYCLVRWAVNRFADPLRHRAQIATAAIIGGLVSFGFFYGLYAWIFHCFFGWRAAIWYGLSLPVAGIIAHYYLRRLRSLLEAAHDTFVLLRSPGATKRLLTLRAQLIEEIEAVRRAIKVQLPTSG